MNDKLDFSNESVRVGLQEVTQFLFDGPLNLSGYSTNTKPSRCLAFILF